MLGKPEGLCDFVMLGKPEGLCDFVMLGKPEGLCDFVMLGVVAIARNNFTEIVRYVGEEFYKNQNIW